MASTSKSSLPDKVWQRTLAAVDKEKQCASQRNLARAAELLNYINSCFEGDRTPPLSEASKIVLANLEILHLPIRHLSLKTLLRSDISRNLADYLAGVVRDYNDGERPQHNSGTAGLAIEALQRALRELTFVMLIDDYTPSHPNDYPSAGHYKAALQSAGAASACIERAWKIDGPTVKAFLEDHGSQLTDRDFKEMSRVCAVRLSLKALLLQRNDENTLKAKPALDLYFLHLKEEPHSWYACSRIMEINFLLRLICHGHVPERYHLKMSKALERQLKVAEAAMPTDPLDVVWACYDLANVMAALPTGWKYDRLESLQKRGNERMAECKRWLPPYFRKELAHGVDIVEMLLEAAPKQYPRDYRQRMINSITLFASHGAMKDGVICEIFDITSHLKHLKHCAACQNSGKDMSLCGRVSNYSISYHSHLLLL